MYQYNLLDMEIFIVDRDEKPEYNASRGYFIMYEESGNIDYEIFKPKNIF